MDQFSYFDKHLLKWKLIFILFLPVDDYCYSFSARVVIRLRSSCCCCANEMLRVCKLVARELGQV